MRAELKKLHSPDVIEFNENNTNKITEKVLFIQAFIGPVGLKGEESFDILICTPEWIKEQLVNNKFILGRSKIIINDICFQNVYKIIEMICNKTYGNTWEEIANKLNLYFSWEFGNYKE